MASLKAIEQRLAAWVSRLLDLFIPLMRLWPWLAVNLVFYGFLESSQGLALAEGARLEPLPTFALVAATASSFLLALLFGLLVVLADQHVAVRKSVCPAVDYASSGARFCKSAKQHCRLLPRPGAPATTFVAEVVRVELLLLQTLCELCRIVGELRRGDEDTHLRTVSL